MLRRIISLADYDNNRDLTWARTDPDPVVRWWATRADYRNSIDASWAKIDTGVKWLAAWTGYGHNKDLTWTETDPYSSIKSGFRV